MMRLYWCGIVALLCGMHIFSSDSARYMFKPVLGHPTAYDEHDYYDHDQASRKQRAAIDVGPLVHGMADNNTTDDSLPRDLNVVIDYETGNQALHDAIINKKVTKAIQLIKAGAPLTQENWDGEKPLVLAVKQDLLTVVGTICDGQESAAAGWFAPLRKSMTRWARGTNIGEHEAIERAYADGNDAMLELLARRQPLISAALARKMIQFFPYRKVQLAQNYNVTAFPMHHQIITGEFSMDEMKSHIEKSPLSVFMKDDKGKTYLIYAVYFDRYELADCIISRNCPHCHVSQVYPDGIQNFATVALSRISGHDDGLEEAAVFAMTHGRHKMFTLMSNHKPCVYVTSLMNTLAAKKEWDKQQRRENGDAKLP